MIALAIPNVAQAAEGSNGRSKNNCNDAREGIQYYRERVWTYQSGLGIKRSYTEYAERAIGCRYVNWAAKKWRHTSRNLGAKWRSINNDPKRAICYIFGEYCSQALRVSACETGHTYHVGASNGQYLGLFQMGDYARSRYGHGNTALEQARAAYRYFVDSGRDWSPWSCKP